MGADRWQSDDFLQSSVTATLIDEVRDAPAFRWLFHAILPSTHAWPAACQRNCMPTTATASPLETTLAQPLARLMALEATAFPVLSVYLNTQPDQHGHAADPLPLLHRELKALARTWQASSPQRHSFDRDAERILSYAGASIDPAARGVAIFACWGAQEFFETLQLRTPINDNRVSADDLPDLFQLALVDERYPRYAAVLANMTSARIFVLGLGQVLAAEQINGERVHGVKEGAWTQERYQRRQGNARIEHAKEVAERLVHLVREDKINHIILAGEPVVIPLIQKELPREMSALVEVMRLNFHASEEDVLTATLKKLSEDEVKSDRGKVERLMQQYRARRLAVAGVQETMAALENGQVDELLISAGLDESSDSSAAERLVTKAKQTDAAVTFIEDVGLLHSIGGVGAFLRWRS